jgi:hypothetical protein
MHEKPQNLRNGNKWIPIVVAILGAAFGGGSSTWYVLSGGVGAPKLEQLARPDPFTGSEGQRLQKKLDLIMADLVRLERRVDKLPPRELELEITLLRSDLNYLKERVERLEKPNR